MKNCLFALLLLCSFAACKKNDPDPTPDPAPNDSTIAGVRFTNQLDMRVVIDIYDTAYVPVDSFYSYPSRFLYRKPKMRLIANPNATVVLPKDSFTQGNTYYYDWYTDSLDISSWHNVTSAMLDTMALDARNNPYGSDSMFYRLSFSYDSTTKAVDIKMNGKPEKWRKLFSRNTLWVLAASYDSTGAVAPPPPIPVGSRNMETGLGFTLGSYTMSGVFKFDHIGNIPVLKVYKHGTQVGVISQSFPSAGLTTTAKDTIFLQHTNNTSVGNNIYKMYLSKRYDPK